MSQAQCLNCKEIIESKYRHSFVTCSCFTNEIGNKGIYLDGGDEYIRAGGCLENFKLIQEIVKDEEFNDPYGILDE